MNSQNAKKASSSTEDLTSGRVEEILRAGAARLREADVDAPRLCAEMLMAHLLGTDRDALCRASKNTLSTDQAARYEALLMRRLAREPVQHILGRTEFWSLDILCDPSALIPRPETEVVVETTLAILKNLAAPAIADIGTGTGCIAIALARELPAARLYASDFSRSALELAARNLAAHGLTQRVQLLEGDLAEPFLKHGLAGRLDAIVCNPPYVAESEKATLQPEVRDYEPDAALYGGGDGLQVLARLLAETGPLLKPGGHLIVEIAQGQAPAVRDLAEKPARPEPSRRAAWRVIRTIADPAGIERVLLIQKEKLQ
ncbi:MAG: peptide chain release factor N(5)-glutamine methyltransferase [Candidatus Brocadiia bacterium]|jgi:release factor glutamine methyltransferase